MANPKDPKNPHGPVKVGKFTIKVDPDLCIGAGTCAVIAAKTFELDPQAKAVILETGDAEVPETIIAAARGCPTAAIIIEDENGNRVYPK